MVGHYNWAQKGIETSFPHKTIEIKFFRPRLFQQNYYSLQAFSCGVFLRTTMDGVTVKLEAEEQVMALESSPPPSVEEHLVQHNMGGDDVSTMHLSGNRYVSDNSCVSLFIVCSLKIHSFVSITIYSFFLFMSNYPLAW